MRKLNRPSTRSLLIPVSSSAMVRHVTFFVEDALAAAEADGEKLARMLLDHLEGILSYCRIKVPLGVAEAVNGNIKALLRPGRGYCDLNYLLLKAQRLAATQTQFIVLQKAA